MADSTLSNLTSLTLPSQATDLLLVGRGTARPNKVAMSDALNSAALAATTTAYGVVLLAPNGGTTAGTVVQANDSRLTGGGGGGVTSLTGTANQITASASTGAVTLSLPSNLIAPGTLTLGSYLQTGGYARINGLTAGTNTYLQLWNGASTIGLLGSRASIDGGAAADVGLYVYGANNLTFWTNSAIAATVSSNGNLLIGGTTDISGNGGLKVFGNSASANTTSGALQVVGGIGVGGAINAGGTISTFSGGVTRTSLNTDGTLFWGVSANLGVLTWDTNKARVGAQGTADFALTTGTSTDRLRISGTTGDVTIINNATVNGSLTVSGTANSSFAGSVSIRKDQVGTTYALIDNQNAAGTADLFLTQDGGSSNYFRIARNGSGTATPNVVNISNVVGGAAGTTAIEFGSPVKVLNTTNSSSAITGALIVGNGTNGGIGVSGRSFFGEQVNVKSIEATGTASAYNSTGGISLFGAAGSAYAGIKAYTDAAGTEKTISLNPAAGAGVHIGGTGAVEGGGLRVGSIMAVGAATDVSVGLNHRPTLTTGSFQYGMYSSPSITAATADSGFFTMRTAASSAVSSAFLLRTYTPTLGSGSTVSNIFGLRIENLGGTGISNAYGIDIAAQSGASTTNVGLRNAGTTLLTGDLTTSANLFAGTTYFSAPNGINIDTTGSASLRWNDAGTQKWWLYKLSGDVNLYLRDMVNARMQATFTPGSSSGIAASYLWSSLYVDSTVNSTSYNSGALQVVGGVGIGGALFSQQNSNAIVTGTNFANTNAGTAATLRHTLIAGTNTSTIEAYSNGHATFPGRLRFGTTNGQMDFVPSGVLGLSISASAVTTPVGLINISKSGAGSTLEINADSGFTSKLSFQRATTNRWTVECDSSDNLTYYYLGTTRQLNLASSSSNVSLSLGPTGAAYIHTIRSATAGGAIQIKGDPSTGDRYLSLGHIDNASAYTEGLRIDSNAIVRATGTTASTDVTSGALVIGNGTSGGLGVSGAIYAGGILKTTVADAAYNARFFGATGGMRVRGYTDATYGTVVDSLNTAESVYQPLTIASSSLRLNDLTNGAIVTGTGTFTAGGTVIANAATNAFRIPTAQTPASQTASGTQGQITWDASYLYVCTSTNNWGRSSLNWSGGGGGSTNVWIPASAWIPRTTTGAGIDSRELSTNKINTDELLFDAGTDEFAQALVVMPNNWNAGTVTAKFHWTASTSSGDVVWGLSGRAYANDDALDQAQGTAQTVTDTLTATNDVDITSATSAITLAGTAASGNPVIFEVYRDANAGGDTLATDARLLGVEISYTAS